MLLLQERAPMLSSMQFWQPIWPSSAKTTARTLFQTVVVAYQQQL
jgi:hypothetical protein